MNKKRIITPRPSTKDNILWKKETTRWSKRRHIWISYLREYKDV